MPVGPHVVALAAEHRLIAQAIAAALRHHGLTVEELDWRGCPATVPVATQLRTTGADVGLYVGQPEVGPHLAEVLWLLDQSRVPWIVMTTRPVGPAAGALLMHGAVAVLHEPTSLDALGATVVAAARGEIVDDVTERGAMIDLWQRQPPGVRLLVARLRRLSPRERQVMELLHGGQSVSEIAERLGIQPGTVRSQVKAMLRKLGMRSQREAVLALERLRQRSPRATQLH